MKTKEWTSRRPQHLVARIVCLLLALVTWLCVMRISDPVLDETVSGIPITVKDSVSLTYTGTLDQTTMGRVRIRGTKSALYGIQASDISAYVDMNDLLLLPTPAEDETYEMTVRVRLKAKS